MRLIFAFALFAILGRASAAEKPMPALGIEELPSPAGVHASGAALARGPGGAVWLSWLEPTAKQTALRFSILDLATKKWREPRTIAQGDNWLVNWAEVPTLAVAGDGRAAAVWSVSTIGRAHSTDSNHGPSCRAMISQTADHGKTWSEPRPLTVESDRIEFVSLAALSDGRFIAAWLDGRALKTGQHTRQLYARVLGSADPDIRIDASVCDCCPTSLTAFLDGSALVAYRGRSAAEVRDIRTARFRGGKWENSRILHPDGWRIAGCPVNGPHLVSDGGRVAIAWFTGADHDPRVLASFSPDAGLRFLMPIRLDASKPAGHPRIALLRDGAMLATWRAVDGQLWLRRISPELTPNDPIVLANSPGKGMPQIVIAHDYAGGKSSAEIVVACPRPIDNAGIRTLLVTVPEGDLVEVERNCECAPSAEQLQGYPMRGKFLEITSETGRVRVEHPELPGIFPAGTRELRVGAEVLGVAQPGREFLGRIDRRAGDWWLYDVRLLARPR